jgi:hypothetical protein
MAIFYFHPNNLVAQKLRNQHGARHIIYSNTNELEFAIKKLILESGDEISPRTHLRLGALGGDIMHYIKLEETEADEHARKLCKLKSPWSAVKVINPPESYVIGYCSSSNLQPVRLTAAQQAQLGLISSSYVPVAL